MKKPTRFTPLADGYQKLAPSELMRLFPELTFAAVFEADGARPVLAVACDESDLPSYSDESWGHMADVAWDFFFDLNLFSDDFGLPSSPVTLASFLDATCDWNGSVGALYLPLRAGEMGVEPTMHGVLVRPDSAPAFELTSRSEWERFLRSGGAGDRFVDFMAELIAWEEL